MAHGYRAIGWNRQKRLYDGVLVGGVAVYLSAFVGVGAVSFPQATAETLLIRALGSGAFLLLHLVLSIGPLCRLSPRFLPLLYNRRHMGVTMFTLALAHGTFAVVQFHALGDLHPLVSVLTAEATASTTGGVPFQPLGLAALAVLFLMAATSHDFWLAHLTPPLWKSLHMLVYLAYGLLVLHVAFGVLQDERHPAYLTLLAAGGLWLATVHLLAARRERRTDVERPAGADGWVSAGPALAIPDLRAKVLCVGGERVAVFRYGDRVSAVSNVCQHQNGPLGEGRVIDGCITCPWHGFQYDPATGASPPPFTERVPTFRVRIEDGEVLVHPRPLPPGTRVEPARLGPPEATTP